MKTAIKRRNGARQSHSERSEESRISKIEILNQYSGLFALLAVIAAVVVPVVLYKKQKKDIALAEKKRKEEERQNAKDELDAMTEHSPFPMDDFTRAKHARISYLEKRLGRR